MNSRLPLAFQFLLFSLSFFNPIFVRTELTAHFRQFLNENYGDGFADQMARNDMGVGLAGSFGGKWNGQEAIENQPVIFIHGVTLRAAIFMAHRNFFLNKGYSSAELYATTYSDGGKTPFYYNDLRCENVKQVRSFIIAVHEYSNKSVDIIAYSMGAAISRKAILGGRCAETGENLGPPLTPYIDTYVSVGGVAYGMERCPENLPACNAKNGMLCTSDYMKNVNGQKGRYEGNISFGISSSDDFIVGQHCCGHQCSELKNADQNILFSHFDHITLFSQTVPLQYSLVTSHKVIDPK